MTTDLDVRPVPPDLADLAERLRRTLPELGRPLARPWTEEPTLLLDRGRPWLVGPVERDPHRRDGRTVMPREQIRRLATLAERQLPVRRLAIAHELDRDGPVRALLPELRRGSRACTDEVARLVTGPAPPHPGVRRTVRVLDGLVGGAARATAAAVEELLDPILFAIAAPDAPESGSVCLWYPISVWRW